VDHVRGVLSPYVLLLVALAVVTAYLGWLAWRDRAEPGSRPFAWLMVTQTGWTLSYAVAVVTFAPTIRQSLEVVEWLLGGLVPVWWLAFALAYTGRGRWVTRRTLLAAAVVPVVTAALIATNGRHDLMWSGYHIVEGVPIATVAYSYGPWFYVQIGYSYLQMLAGFALLVAMLFRYDTLYTDQVAAVGVGVFLPWLGNVLWVLGLTPVRGLDLTQYAIAVGGILLGHGLLRYDLLAFVPATRQVGERTVVHDLEEGVMMVDADGAVQWLNPTAAETFAADGDGVAGTPVADVLGEDVDLDVQETTVEATTSDGRRTYEVRVSDIADQHGDAVGHALVLSDVTHQRLRRQRLQVVNRVLRHNLRNEMTVVRLAAERIVRERGDPVDHAETIIDQSDELVDLAGQVQATERVVGGDVTEERAVGVADLLDRVARSVCEDHPAADVRIDAPAGLVVRTDPDLLEAVVTNAVENAARHAGDGPRVEVTATAEAGWLVVEVADDGPGIPTDEVAAVRSGEETKLLHGSGMGLWLLDWGTTRLGGTLSFGESDRGGAAVTIRVPGTDPEQDF
jgi:signal transduction histidine kinase